MATISFRNFRGFHNTVPVPLAPITVLVGENSAGKSSFLAGLKFVLDFASGQGEASFNSDPFQLGTFDQIAHFRGGGGGRAREFSIALEDTVSISRRPKKSGSRNSVEDHTVRFQLTFTSSDSHAAVSSMVISCNRERLVVAIRNDGLAIDYYNTKNDKFPIGNSKYIPRVARIDFPKYWPFLLRDLRLRVSRKEDDLSPELLNEGIEDSVGFLTELAVTLSRKFSSSVFATSAIRTKPQRTYTPGIESVDGEGSHVPYEIAKAYRSRVRNKEEWGKIKEKLEAFGIASQMFKEISVKSFGSTASDPFQIVFASGGPKTNLVDLGYGTSQVLPILYSVSTAPTRSQFLIQQPEVHLHPRAQSALGQYFVDAAADEGKRFVLETHSDFIVDRVRNSIADSRLSVEDVSILFFERQRLENSICNIRLNEKGEPINPPLAYRSFFIGEQMKMLGL